MTLTVMGQRSTVVDQRRWFGQLLATRSLVWALTHPLLGSFGLTNPCEGVALRESSLPTWQASNSRQSRFQTCSASALLLCVRPNKQVEMPSSVGGGTWQDGP